MRDFPLLHLFLSFRGKGEKKPFERKIYHQKEKLFSFFSSFIFHFVVAVRPKKKEIVWCERKINIKECAQMCVEWIKAKAVKEEVVKHFR